MLFLYAVWPHYVQPGGVFAFCPMPMSEEAGFGSGPAFPASGGAEVFAQRGLSTQHNSSGNPAATL